uniref:Cell envelope-related transcriptional attenuator n=1 Tax=uncultured Microgenomates bacterium Rifle_16ft_4_minimus_5036 TaxID=1665119 RepID=A0A0H4TCU2_9BACT|nr:cell envelope-related transcriptional attenuator [uncultured Microgenomates bacterium Rifle_16ft_4_minimus_5036]
MILPALKLRFKSNLFLFVLLSVGIFVSSAFLAYFLLKNYPIISENAVTYTSTSAPITPFSESANSYNILLLGYGGAGHPGGTLSDVMMVVNINPESKKITFVSIPRDLWVEMPVSTEKSVKHKINFAYAIGVDNKSYPDKESKYTGVNGGGEMAKYAAEKVTGLPIHKYAAVDFRGFEKVIDILGGVDVGVPETFDDYFYPVQGLEDLSCDKTAEEIASLSVKYSGFELEKQFPCRYERLHFDKGMTHMDGVTALKYVRSRHSDQHGGDFARSERQQSLLLGLRKKLATSGFISKSDEVFDNLATYIQTDIDKDVVKFFLSLPGKPAEYEVKSVNLSTDNVLINAKSSGGEYILIPKSGEGGWGPTHQFIENELSPTSL